MREFYWNDFSEKILTIFFKVFVKLEFSWDLLTSFKEEEIESLINIISAYDISSLEEREFLDLMTYVNSDLKDYECTDQFMQFIVFYIILVLNTTIFLNKKVNMQKLLN